jgi:hypothetical protein
VQDLVLLRRIEQAVVAQDLERQLRDLVAEVGRVELRHQLEDARVVTAGAARQLHVARVLVRAHVALDRDQPVADRRVLDRGMPAAPRGLREVHQPLKERVGLRGRADRVSLVLQRGTRDLPALAALADDPVLRRAGVGEEDLVEVRPARHLAQRSHLDAGLLHRDQQVGDAGMLDGVRLGAREAEHVVGLLRLGGPDLLPVDHPLVADELRARLERGEVAA